MTDINPEKLFSKLPSGFSAQVIQEETLSLSTRLAESAIQANTSVKDRETWLRVFKDGKQGLASGRVSGEASEADLVKRSIENWEFAHKISPPRVILGKKPSFEGVHDKAIEKEDPVFRANQLSVAVRAAEKSQLTYTGSFSTRSTHRSISDTDGGKLSAKTTMADVSCTITSEENSTGWARDYSSKLKDIDVTELLRIAGGKALNSRRKNSLKPGKHMVVLEPAAVGSMLLFLGFLSFGGRVFNRGTSFLSGKTGQKVMAKHLSIYDDASDPRMGGWPFDYEGTPVQRVNLVENGIARGVVHDSETAQQAGTVSTGHALAPGNGFGPYPRCVHMKPGETDLKTLLGSIDKAILVTRLWYINYANPMRTMITGTTRDGTFLIEKGRPVKAVNDMRFVESILDAFNRSTLLSKERRYVRQFGSTLHVPWMVIPDFTFTEVI